jgi:hypothetical protein
VRWAEHKASSRSGTCGKLSDRVFNNLRNATTQFMVILEWTDNKKREGVWVKYFEKDLGIALMNVLLK